ncbi:MAG: lipid-A-disaccharide synthase [Candidatus Competibacterales bacterium]
MSASSSVGAGGGGGVPWAGGGGVPWGVGWGGGLLLALKEHFPHLACKGGGGPAMAGQGLVGLADLEALSVMGLVEVLGHLPRLWRLNRQLAAHIAAWRPHAFIGIDAPDFNLPLARGLRRRGVMTVQLVSPSVWAWRRGRMATIKAAVDLMLVLFPFEADIYRRAGVAVSFVGHPLADAIPLVVDGVAARRQLGLPAEGTVLAVLPGSRRAEVTRLLPPFIDTVRWLAERHPGLRVVTPAATPTLGEQIIHTLRQGGGDVPWRVVAGRAQEVLAACDVALVASGTAALEALLFKKPMVVAYKLAPVTAWLARRLVAVPHFALPNLLAGEPLVAEFFQEQVTASTLGPALGGLLSPAAAAQERGLVDAFGAIHTTLRRDACRGAAAAIVAAGRGRGIAAFAAPLKPLPAGY